MRIILLNIGILNFSEYSSKSLNTIEGLGFRLIGTLRGYTGCFSATVVEIIDIGKQVCKLCDGESKNYTLIEIEIFSRIQVHTNNKHTSTRSDDDGDYNSDRDEELNLKSYTFSSDSTSSDVKVRGCCFGGSYG